MNAAPPLFPHELDGLALGDSIIISGGAVYAHLKRGEPIRVNCSSKWRASVSAFYRNYPGIQVTDAVFTGDPKVRELYPKYTLFGPPMAWYRGFGVKGGTPFSARWDYCPITALAREIEPVEGPEIFVHDDASRGYVVPVEGYRPPFTESLLDHVPYLKTAREIHCMESSIMHLLESMERVAGKLFFYPKAKPGYIVPVKSIGYPPLPLKHDWEFV